MTLRMIGLFCLVYIHLIGCSDPTFNSQATRLGNESASTQALNSKADSSRRIGVFLTSHGDVNTYEEIEPYIRSAFLKNVGVPLPKTLRKLIQDPAYWVSRDTIEEQYEIIGPTYYRENAQIQMDALTEALVERNLPAKVYIGYNFMPSFIEDTLEQMHKDGVNEIVVFNKGAQFSLATLGESIEEMETYLKDHPEWNVRITAVRQFSDDPRFIELFAQTLERDAETYFPNVPKADRCLFIASHGLPIRLINMGDPAVEQMKGTVEALRKRLPEYPIYHGFLNDDFFPGAEWVSPNSDDVAYEIRSDSCPAVLMDGRLSFTTHHRATLFDLDVAAREVLEEPDFLPDGETPHPLWNPSKVILAPQWDGDKGFADLLADLTRDALMGKGDLIQIR